MLIDTHCHLFNEYYENIEEIINNAKNNDVKKYISAATNVNNSKEMIDLANKFKNIYVAVGIHPEDVNDNAKEIKELLEINKDNDKIIAIGEIGLDYYYTKDNKDKQLELFDYQLSLAEEYNLPVVIHSREATLDTVNMLKKHNCRGVIHCFSGSIETAREYLKLGYYIGVGGVITFKNANIKDVIKEIPLDRIILETDSPYLAPVPHRGERNEPKNIKSIALFLADLFDVSFEEIMDITTNNVVNLYSINIID